MEGGFTYFPIRSQSLYLALKETGELLHVFRPFPVGGSDPCLVLRLTSAKSPDRGNQGSYYLASASASL